MYNSNPSQNGQGVPLSDLYVNRNGETLVTLAEKIAVVVPLENREYTRLYDEQMIHGWFAVETKQLVETAALMALNTVRGYWIQNFTQDDEMKKEVLRDSAKRMAELFKTYNVYSPRYQWTDVRCINEDEIVLLGTLLQREFTDGDFNYQRS